TNLGPLASHACLQDITYSQLPPDLVNTFGASLVLHRRSSCDHSEPLRKQPPQLINHLVRETVTEIILLRITIQVLEWQYRQQDLSRARVHPRGPVSEISNY